MKIKKLFMAFFMVFLAIEVQAQSYDYPSFHMGIRGGVTFNSMSGKYGDYYSSKTFPYGGLAFDFRLAPIPLYLETGVYYANRGVKINKNYVIEQANKLANLYNPNGNYVPLPDPSGNKTNDITYVYSPILISYHHYFTGNISIQPFAGGYVGYLDKYKKAEYGIRFGCGFNYSRLYANVGYDIGLLDVGVSGSKGHFKTLFLTLGFNIVGSR